MTAPRMQGLLKDVLLLQREWSWRNTLAMQRRGSLIEREVAAWLRELLPELSNLVPPVVDDLRVAAGDGSGRKAEIPWARVYSAARSPSSTIGWYVVYLFSADGERVYLSLNQATTRRSEDGRLRARPLAELHDRVARARQRLVADLAPRPDLVDDIILAGRPSGLGPGYERGNVAAFVYSIDAIPPDQSLETDLRFLVSVLGKLYSGIPGSGTPRGTHPGDGRCPHCHRAGSGPSTSRSRITTHCRRTVSYRAACGSGVV